MIFQGSDQPAFKCISIPGNDLKCSNCQHVLIEGYHEASFIGIAIRCFKCREVTSTPSLLAGEVCPKVLVLLNDSGNFLLGDSVTYQPSVAMISDAEHKRAIEACSPSKKSAPFDLTETGIQSLIDAFEFYSGRSVSNDLKILARHQSNNESGAWQMPFAWAAQTIRLALIENRVDLQIPAHNIALGRLLLFNNVVTTWKHHPRFKQISRELANPNSFFHTLSQFCLADYLYNADYQTGFSTLNIPGQPKTDLYIRVSASQNEHIELKAPQCFLWDKFPYASKQRLNEQIVRLVRKNRQISSKRPGHLSIVLEDPRPASYQLLKSSLSATLSKIGRDRSGLISVIAMGWQGVIVTKIGSIASLQAAFRIEQIPNPHFQKA